MAYTGSASIWCREHFSCGIWVHDKHFVLIQNDRQILWVLYLLNLAYTLKLYLKKPMLLTCSGTLSHRLLILKIFPSYCTLSWFSLYFIRRIMDRRQVPYRAYSSDLFSPHLSRVRHFYSSICSTTKLLHFGQPRSPAITVKFFPKFYTTTRPDSLPVHPQVWHMAVRTFFASSRAGIFQFLNFRVILLQHFK